MKILSISGILPIPGLIGSNDFVFQTYRHYQDLYKEDEVFIIRPTQYKTNIKKILTGKTEFNLLKGKSVLTFFGITVAIFPFLSSRRFRNLYAILAYSILILNRKKLQLLLNKTDFDAIHAQYIFPDGLLAYLIKKKYKIPYMITTHNELFYFKHVVSNKIAVRILQNASYVVPINYSSYRYFDSIGLKNIELVPLGFNKVFLRPQKEPAKGAIKILTVAELIRLKNTDKVILAVNKLVKKYNITYTIIGRGPEKEKLLHMVDQFNLGRYVEFIDQVDHNRIADEMYKHDIFIMPSYVETFGRVYFEAMAMGIPVICAKNSGIFGYFKEKEEGISVNHNDIDEIAGMLELLIANPKLRQSVGQKGQTLVKSFTWEKIAEILHGKYLHMKNSK
jgi:glycosyltransferase involved in cell wall biosynthesis